jgi:hypothetical protein
MMTTFDKREQGFEAKFVHDEELRFKVMARASKLLGNWAASQLGLAGEQASAYANGIVTTHLETQTTDDILQKVAGDLAAKGVSPQQVATKLQEYMQAALAQIEASK